MNTWILRMRNCLGQVKPFHSASLSFFPASSWELWLWVIIRNLSEGFVWTFRAVASPSLHVPTQNITFSIVCLDRLCDRKLESVVCLCWGTMLSSHPMLCLVNPPTIPYTMTSSCLGVGYVIGLQMPSDITTLPLSPSQSKPWGNPGSKITIQHEFMRHACTGWYTGTLRLTCSYLCVAATIQRASTLLLCSSPLFDWPSLSALYRRDIL